MRRSDLFHKTFNAVGFARILGAPASYPRRSHPIGKETIAEFGLAEPRLLLHVAQAASLEVAQFGEGFGQAEVGSDFPLL